MRVVPLRFASVLLLAALGGAGCATMATAGKVVVTPLVVVRDVVDAPLVSLANLFEDWAERSSKTPTPSVGVGTGGVHAGINLGYWGLKPFSLLFGGLDYLVCRSLWPDWPSGLSPWRAEGEGWGSLYFPNTRALWSEEPIPGEDDEAPAPPPADKGAGGR